MKYKFQKSTENTENELRQVLKALGKKNPKTQKPIIIPRSHKEMIFFLKNATKGVNFNRKILSAIENYDRTDFFDWQANPANEITVTPYTFMAPIYAKNQTIPSPHIILSQLDELDIQNNQVILEIGAGSGYNAVITANSANNISLITTEIDQELLKIAKYNIRESGMGAKVWAKKAYKLGVPNQKFDRIYSSVAATSPEQIETLLDQLKINGKMRLPVVKQGNTPVISDSRLWIPGEEIKNEEIYVKDSVRMFTRQAAYLFEKIDDNKIEYKITVPNAIGPNLK